jgi:hypothetical protein
MSEVMLQILKNGNNKRVLYLVSKLVQCMDRRRGTNMNNRKKLKMAKLGEKEMRLRR